MACGCQPGLKKRRNDHTNTPPFPHTYHAIRGQLLADPHATAQVQVRVRANCSTVRSEMLARVTSATWIDPHNNGTYAIENQSLWNRLDISRVSGAAAPGRYTDRIAFTFADEGAGAVSDPSTTAAGPACLLSGCSESQAHRFIQSTQTLALPRNPKSNPDPNPKPEP